MINTVSDARPGMPQVVFHGFTVRSRLPSNIDEATNVTEYVRELRWSHSVHAPYENMQLEMTIPAGMFQRVLPGVDLGKLGRAPATGFWVVLYLPNETDDGPIWSACHWGYATGLGVRMATNQETGVQNVMISVSCESWVDCFAATACLWQRAQTMSEMAARSTFEVGAMP